MQVSAPGSVATGPSPASGHASPPHPLWLHARACAQRRGRSTCDCGPFEAVVVHLPCEFERLPADAPASRIACADALTVRLAGLLSPAEASESQAPAAAAPRRVFKGGLTGSTQRRAQALLSGSDGAILSMGDIAKRCGLSRSHFSKAFKQSTGLSPRDWQIEDRIRRAELLLRDLRLPIADVATQCGFADQSHLTRLFKRFRGVTPARWRRRLGA